METRRGPNENVKSNFTKNDEYINNNERDTILNDDEGGIEFEFRDF